MTTRSSGTSFSKGDRRKSYLPDDIVSSALHGSKSLRYPFPFIITFSLKRAALNRISLFLIEAFMAPVPRGLPLNVPPDNFPFIVMEGLSKVPEPVAFIFNTASSGMPLSPISFKNSLLPDALNENFSISEILPSTVIAEMPFLIRALFTAMSLCL